MILWPPFMHAEAIGPCLFSLDDRQPPKSMISNKSVQRPPWTRSMLFQTLFPRLPPSTRHPINIPPPFTVPSLFSPDGLRPPQLRGAVYLRPTHFPTSTPCTTPHNSRHHRILSILSLTGSPPFPSLQLRQHQFMESRGHHLTPAIHISLDNLQLCPPFIAANLRALILPRFRSLVFPMCSIPNCF
jgi:hypothetical protein